jgi:hypothetical protein
MVQTNLAFEVVYDDAISMPLVCVLSTISFHAYFDVSSNNEIGTPTLVELVSIKTYSSVDDHFPFI